jgi:hypothetical protein
MSAIRTAAEHGFSTLAWRIPRLRRPLRDALILVGLGRAAYYFFVQGIRPWEQYLGVDARAYWGIDLAHPYIDSVPGGISAYLYSPAFAQLMAPVSLLPFPVFFALWTAMSLAICAWLLRPWPWAAPMLALPIIYELSVGNIHFLMAAAIVVSFRYPPVWALFVLTKITPGVGALWFAFRGQWRSFAIAVGSTAAIVGVSFLLQPAAWQDWYAFLTAGTATAEVLPLRLGLAAVLLVLGARRGWRWVIPIAVWISLPAVYVNSWVILLAVIRLRDRA